MNNMVVNRIEQNPWTEMKWTRGHRSARRGELAELDEILCTFHSTISFMIWARVCSTNVLQKKKKGKINGQLTVFSYLKNTASQDTYLGTVTPDYRSEALVLSLYRLVFWDNGRKGIPFSSILNYQLWDNRLLKSFEIICLPQPHQRGGYQLASILQRMISNILFIVTLRKKLQDAAVEDLSECWWSRTICFT